MPLRHNRPAFQKYPQNRPKIEKVDEKYVAYFPWSYPYLIDFQLIEGYLVGRASVFYVPRQSGLTTHPGGYVPLRYYRKEKYFFREGGFFQTEGAPGVKYLPLTGGQSEICSLFFWQS